MSGNSPDELEATLSEIRRLNAAFLPWQIRIGPVRLARRVWSMHFFFTFTLFHIGAGVVGGVFIFMREPFRSLGIAIVVGALFAFGSFLTQVWAQSVEKEYKLLELNGGKEIERRLAEAHARYLDLLRRDLPPGTEPDPLLALQQIMGYGEPAEKKKSAPQEVPPPPEAGRPDELTPASNRPPA
ncbi:hypothetical protein [Phytohabitans suffuscus]